MTQGVHTEDRFEALVEAHLVGHGGYESASPSDYDTDRAVMPDILASFVEATQPEAWAKLRGHHGDSLSSKLVAQACSVMDKRGVLTVLRHGFKFFGQTIKLAYFRPGNGHTPATRALYAQNRLIAVRQLRYDPKNSNELALTLFLNGVPIVTAELNSELTGRSASHGVEQYRQRRDPKAPIFRWGKRTLIHFAVSSDAVWMTTRLAGLRTRFLPFNRGDKHGAGNPPDESGGHQTTYLWETIWQRDSLLDIIGRFIHLQKDTGKNPNTRKKWVKEAIIFPRYHQLDCVRRLVDSALAAGPGTHHLIQHAAGSGRSNTLSWLADRLANLRDAADTKIYDSVVVMTDRRVLDRQLQDAIYQLEHEAGVVDATGAGGAKLAKALKSGAPIVVCAMGSFGSVQEAIDRLPDRRYALIVDEAHASQSGETTVLELCKAMLQGPNVNIFAFTATPKPETLAAFGHKDSDGKPAPFHLYAMQQAIEERFVLDVLRGYTTYKRFFELAVASSPSARFANLHPTTLAQKTELIIEHFRACVMHRLGGKAKAMVVAGSQLEAVRYKHAFDSYLADKGYSDVRALVAFSGEPELNNGLKETELPAKFGSDTYQLLVVGDEYQTRFDQPLLTAMYVDKALGGVQAVQTLSRLNGIATGKEQIFVLDFVNTRDDILTSFQPYYAGTSAAEAIEPRRVYELQHELNEMLLYTASEVDGFAQVLFKLKTHQNLSENSRLNGWLSPAIDRFKALADEGESGVEQQKDFRSKLTVFCELYSLHGHIIPLQDAGLERLYAYAWLLLKKLPCPENGGSIEPDDEVALVSLKLKNER